MRAKRIDHLGIAVADLAAAKRFYEDVLGLKLEREETVGDQGVKTHFYRIGETKLELLESIDPSGAIAKFVDKRGPGLQHVAIEVEDLDAALRELAAKGVRLIDAKARKGVEDTRIAFLHPGEAHGVLVELVEFPKKR